MKVYCAFVLLQFVFVTILAKRPRLPQYIKPCSKSAPDFEQCCLEHGKEALPYIIKGDKQVGIPNMTPLVIPEVNVDAGGNLKIFLKDVHVYGLDKNDLKQVKIDLNNKKILIKTAIEKLELVGKYEIDGKVMVLAIRGNGNVKLTATGGVYTYTTEYLLEKVDGEDHLKLTDNDKLEFTEENVKFNFENLFDGDKKLGDQMNKFLNENWKEIINEFGLPISETIKSIGRSIATAYFKKVPYNQLFLD